MCVRLLLLGKYEEREQHLLVSAVGPQGLFMKSGSPTTRLTWHTPVPLPLVLRFRGGGRLPLHVARQVGAPASKRFDVVDDITGTRAAGTAGCRTWPVPLESCFRRLAPLNSPLFIARTPSAIVRFSPLNRQLGASWVRTRPSMIISSNDDTLRIMFPGSRRPRGRCDSPIAGFSGWCRDGSKGSDGQQRGHVPELSRHYAEPNSLYVKCFLADPTKLSAIARS